MIFAWWGRIASCKPVSNRLFAWAVTNAFCRTTAKAGLKPASRLETCPTPLLAIAVLLVLLSACAKKEEKESDAPAPVQVTAVTQNTIRRTVAGDGALFPLDQANVMPKIAAPVQKFYVNRGDHVKQGQLLAVSGEPRSGCGRR